MSHQKITRDIGVTALLLICLAVGIGFGLACYRAALDWIEPSDKRPAPPVLEMEVVA